MFSIYDHACCEWVPVATKMSTPQKNYECGTLEEAKKALEKYIKTFPEHLLPDREVFSIYQRVG